jgi:hypothetical protein
MDTSDHIALGKDEWDLIDSATQIITDERWDRFPKWTMEKASQVAATKMRPIERAIGVQEENPTAPLCILVQDSLSVIHDKPIEAEHQAARERSAGKIQMGGKS